MAHADQVRVELVYCPAPGQCDRLELSLPAGSTVGQALQSSGLLERHGLVLEQLKLGLWSKVVAVETVLREQDRVEIYRALTVDPKEARRQRYRGKRAAPAPKA